MSDSRSISYLMVQDTSNCSCADLIFNVGPYPKVKFPTITARLTEKQIHHSLLFFRTSSSSRNTGRFLNETRIIPPLAFSACVQSLQSMAQELSALQIHFADEEGDPFAVELAGRVGGYVLGNDSDFVILNSEGYRGYIPLDEMVWLLPESQDDVPNGDSNGDFQTVRKARTKKKTGTGAGRGIIPPDGDAQDLALSFCVYSPETLAMHLKIPAALLPLLGAIAGNDFSSRSENLRRNVQALFFERHLSLGQRIERAASTIRGILSPDSGAKRAKHHVGSVMDLIDHTVNTLLSRWTTTMRSGEIDKIIESIVTATLQYAIPKYQGNLGGKESLWSTDVCALHEPGTCPLVPLFSYLAEDDDISIMDEDSQSKIKLRGLYIAAYRKGLLSEKTIDISSTASYWPRLFLENPDMETVGRSIGRPIRIWIYSILADSVGLPVAQDQPDAAESASQEMHDVSDTGEDDHELVDVVEVNSDDEVDLLAPLKGDLQRLHQPDHEATDREAKEQEQPSPVSRTMKKHVVPGTCIVTEHLRRGTRIAEEVVNVIPLNGLLSTVSAPFQSDGTGPLLLRPQTDALTVLLRAVCCDTQAVRTLEREQLTIALSLRWVIYTLHKRADETNSKDRDQERWSKREARCFLASFMCPNEMSEPSIATSPLLMDRNVQLTAQILESLASISELANVLLISNLVPPVSRLFSGKKFHAFLTGIIPLAESAMPSPLWDACQDGLEHAFMEDKRIFGKKLRKVVEHPTPVPAASHSQGSLFTLLAERAA